MAPIDDPPRTEQARAPASVNAADAASAEEATQKTAVTMLLSHEMVADMAAYLSSANPWWRGPTWLERSRRETEALRLRNRIPAFLRSTWWDGRRRLAECIYPFHERDD